LRSGIFFHWEFYFCVLWTRIGYCRSGQAVVTLFPLFCRQEICSSLLKSPFVKRRLEGAQPSWLWGRRAYCRPLRKRRQVGLRGRLVPPSQVQWSPSKKPSIFLRLICLPSTRRLLPNAAQHLRAFAGACGRNSASFQRTEIAIRLKRNACLSYFFVFAAAPCWTKRCPLCRRASTKWLLSP
jgi:hypothetical protein